MAGSPSQRIARPLATEQTQSSLRACEPVTLHCCKPTPISSTPPQTPWVPFAKRSRRRSNTGYGGAPGSMQPFKTYLEAHLHPSRSLPPTLKGCWHLQGSPSGRPLALKPQQQHQQQPLQPRNGRSSQKNISRFLSYIYMVYSRIPPTHRGKQFSFFMKVCSVWISRHFTPSSQTCGPALLEKKLLSFFSLSHLSITVFCSL